MQSYWRSAVLAFDDYRRHDGLGLADRVRRGDVSPAELLETAIAAAERLDPKLNALSQKLYDEARASLSSVEGSAPFAGVPFLLKDVSTAMKGTRTLQGSRLFADAAPAEIDSTLTERFRRAGVVIFGKSTTPELGLAPSTETSLTGATRNPWDLSRTAGGSSGGAAAAVAAGIVAIAHASDGGGSIRIPASCCGLFGLKPTRARTPIGPLVGEGWGSLSVSHVVSRSVRDSAAMLDAIEGPAPGDPYRAPRPERPYLSEIESDPRPLRIALQRRPMSAAGVDPEPARAVEEAAALLESLGHRVEEATLPGAWAELGQALWVLVASNVSLAIRRRAEQAGRALSPDLVDPVTWSAVDFSRTLDVEAYPAALQTIHRQGRLMAAFHETYDVILSPTLAQAPIPLGVLRTDNPDLDAYARALAAFMPFTQLFNMTGQPSMTVPLHWSEAGLPIGVMLSAAFGDEATLLRLAAQLERAKPWFDKVPAL
jgi:Asp-tRNA(Asn)/Glu-tRNA(Gln) amidotransferase A subunit family amidase